MVRVDQDALRARRNGDVMLVRDVPAAGDVDRVVAAVEAAGWTLVTKRQRGLFKRSWLLFFAAAEG